MKFIGSMNKSDFPSFFIDTNIFGAFKLNNISDVNTFNSFLIFSGLIRRQLRRDSEVILQRIATSLKLQLMLLRSIRSI